MARKQIQTLERIDSSPRFATAAAILRTLQEGQRTIESRLDALRVEERLAFASTETSTQRLRMQQRLKELRAAAPPTSAASAKPDSQLPAAVSAALELLRTGISPARGDARRTRKDFAQDRERLEDDREIVHRAVVLQQSAVDALRGELSCELARELLPAHRELVLAQFRAAQQLAATTDAEMEFRRKVTEAGYTWRDDLLRAPALRSALILGSESYFDSEVGRMRRQLEEWEVLK
jgi:hypothetical protein